MAALKNETKTCEGFRFDQRPHFSKNLRFLQLFGIMDHQDGVLLKIPIK